MTITEVLPDDAPLRQARRARALAEMEAAGVDILVLGREANARYVSGAPRLWTAGSRPFGPGCVLVRATQAVHLLSTWDEGIPDDIPRDHLYGISFNPASFLQVLRGIDGASTARTVATDALTPGAAQMLAAAFPSADVVDGERLMQRARRVKTPLEVEAIRRSVGIAERSLAAARVALEPGVTERHLTGVFMEAMAAAGVTTPSTQDVARVTSRAVHRDAPVAAGDLVVFHAGVVAGGYIGELGRTATVGDGALPSSLAERGEALWDRLLKACSPGAPLAGLLDAYDTPPPLPVAHGLGLGYDLPLVTHALRRTAAGQHLEVGMVLALTAFVHEPGVGAVHFQEPVHITSNGPEVLS